MAETLTVGELCERVGGAVADAFGDEIWVRGAISGLNRSANGHVYFDLIDPVDEIGRRASAVMPVALFAANKNLVNRVLRRAGGGNGLRMEDGIEIRARGRVTYYQPQGRIQLVMSLIDPAYTLGRMVEARDRLVNTLAAEGLVGANGSVPLTPLPLRIGLITSDQSAAYFDFVREVTASVHPFTITLFDTRVQGADAATGLAAAVKAASDRAVKAASDRAVKAASDRAVKAASDRAVKAASESAGAGGSTDRLDVVVIVRGGGARTDLVAFDDEGLARAIAACSLPVVVGVGHETDRSVADEVAHTSRKTPTAAAAFLVEMVDEFDSATRWAADRLHQLANWHLGTARHRLGEGGGRLRSASLRVTDRQGFTLDQAERRLSQAPSRRTVREADRLEVIEARLGALDPANALRRGWTITYAADGTLVRSPSQVADGDTIRTVTADGDLVSKVDIHGGI